ncbi:MAG: hypothetical protein IKZ21_07675 [Clostridia bacterium]|nr:hypothetical protein [Clostridia bacterium]MBR5869312.1 hypothetical protein [Clostridia bacterium]
MPYVQVRVSVSLTKEQIEKLAAETLNSISLIPGKSAPVTMAEIVPDCNLYFGSVESAPCALVEVAANNNPDSDDLKAYSKQICKALHEIAGIEMKHIYVKHHAFPEWHTGKMFIE